MREGVGPCTLTEQVVWPQESYHMTVLPCHALCITVFPCAGLKWQQASAEHVKYLPSPPPCAPLT